MILSTNADLFPFYLINLILSILTVDRIIINKASKVENKNI